MNKLSTGADSTLGEWMLLAGAFFGPESKAVTYISKQIDKSPNGPDEEVIADEGQFLHVLMQIHLEG